MPAIASACGTVFFIRGVMVNGEPKPAEASGEPSSWRYAYEVEFEPVIYRGDMANEVLDRLGRVRTFTTFDELEFQRALEGLRPA